MRHVLMMHVSLSDGGIDKLEMPAKSLDGLHCTVELARFPREMMVRAKFLTYTYPHPTTTTIITTIIFMVHVRNLSLM
jgi:hypothetical protein